MNVDELYLDEVSSRTSGNVRTEVTIVNWGGEMLKLVVSEANAKRVLKFGSQINFDGTITQI